MTEAVRAYLATIADEWLARMLREIPHSAFWRASGETTWLDARDGMPAVEVEENFAIHPDKVEIAVRAYSADDEDLAVSRRAVIQAEGSN